MGLGTWPPNKGLASPVTCCRLTSRDMQCVSLLVAHGLHSPRAQWLCLAGLVVPCDPPLPFAAGGQRGGHALRALGEEAGEPPGPAAAASAASRPHRRLRIPDGKSE